ncbi:MAG: flavin reductase family protein, partial [Bacteroidota bacterium]
LLSFPVLWSGYSEVSLQVQAFDPGSGKKLYQDRFLRRTSTSGQALRHLSSADIAALDRVPRLNLINSISGIKPANLIGTASQQGAPNLAIFSSVVHLGSNPPLMGMVLRPTGDVPRHSYENLKATGCYTLNQVGREWVEKAHYTSAKVPREVSEFEVCGLTPEWVDGFPAPFVRESRLRIGLRFRAEVPIELNGTILVIGEVEHLMVPEEVLEAGGHMDLGEMAAAGISGLNTYYGMEKIARFPYARPHEIPDFGAK